MYGTKEREKKYIEKFPQFYFGRAAASYISRNYYFLFHEAANRSNRNEREV